MMKMNNMKTKKKVGKIYADDNMIMMKKNNTMNNKKKKK